MDKILSYFKSLSPKQWIFVAVIVLLVIIIIYYLTKKPNGNTINNTNGNNNNVFSVYPLRQGSKGTEVEKLQNCIIKKGGSLPKYGADGDWGPETQAAVLAVFHKSEINLIDIANC